MADSPTGYKVWDGKKNDKQERSGAIAETRKYDKKLSNCFYCWNNKRVPKHLILSIGDFTYLTLAHKGALTSLHCKIVTIDHHVACTMVDDHVWNEIKLFMVSITRMFESKGKKPIFIETVRNVKWQNHLVVEVIPVDFDAFDEAPLYFKKALLESDSNWAHHQKLIDTTVRGIRRSIPPHFSYFYVQFGVETGYAHQIEDSVKWSKNFGEEVIGGILGLDPDLWISPRFLPYNQEVELVKEFLESWKKYDWTTELDGGRY
eukprot:TRINITY_DN3363_c0_g1_i1.p1 TRINITY_DN3363_c0_g1~~TRINITY_DN3363_c0_g1_i1.p1  ORF type:complete len:261 (-),score=32.53 TRINITY_DN3363_c0_g1_i1:46-828(-)